MSRYDRATADNGGPVRYESCIDPSDSVRALLRRSPSSVGRRSQDPGTDYAIHQSTIGKAMSTPNPNQRSTDTPLTDYRLTQIEKTLTIMSDSLRTLTSLEQKHHEVVAALASGASKMADHETRLRSMESEMPTIKLIRGWVIAGVLGIIACAGTLIIKAFIFI